MKDRHEKRRRRFFKRMVSEAVALYDEIAGRPQFRVSELWQLPQKELYQIIPGIYSDTAIIPLEEKIRALRTPKGEVLDLFSRNPINLFIFNQFNGQTSLGQIGLEVSRVFSLDDVEGFDRVRDLFLQLVRLRVCAPRNQGAQRGTGTGSREEGP